jgi:signal transduction histidine kinase
MLPERVIIAFLLILAVLTVFSGCTMQAPAPTDKETIQKTAPAGSTKEQMVAFVKEAVAYARSHDKETALAEFSNRNGSFVRGDLYLYAYDFNGTTIAHPVNPEKIGVNRLYEPDALGNFFIYDLRAAAINGTGFVEYAYINPVHNNTAEKKLGYVEKVDDTWWLGSGIYYGPATPAENTASATGPRTSRALKDYVDNAAAYATANGKSAAIAAFNNRSGPFVQGPDTYVYALDYTGTALALPFQPEKVGTDFLSVKDPSGKPYTAIEIQLARAGGGYLLYQYPDPAANLAPALKISYVRPVDDTYWIGAGIYTSEERLADVQLKQFVLGAKDFVQRYGKEAALAEFNKPDGMFKSGELYIFANDYEGNVLAWPYRPDMIGKNHLDATDAVGEHHIAGLLDKAKNGGGMTAYYTVDPLTNTTALKISYVTDVDGTWMLGAGRYIRPDSRVLLP